MRSVMTTTFFAILLQQNLCGKLLLVLIWTHYWNYFFTEEGRSAGDLNEGEKGKEGGGDRDPTCMEEIV